jgi:hypothetical protein
VSVALSYLDGGLDLVENDAPAVPTAGPETNAAGERQ